MRPLVVARAGIFGSRTWTMVRVTRGTMTKASRNWVVAARAAKRGIQTRSWGRMRRSQRENEGADKRGILVGIMAQGVSRLIEIQGSDENARPFLLLR